MPGGGTCTTKKCEMRLLFVAEGTNQIDLLTAWQVMVLNACGKGLHTTNSRTACSAEVLIAWGLNAFWGCRE